MDCDCRREPQPCAACRARMDAQGVRTARLYPRRRKSGEGVSAASWLAPQSFGTLAEVERRVLKEGV